MPAALPSTEVFAFSEPKNKAGELFVAINLGVGVQHVLHAPRTVWANLQHHLAKEFPDDSAPAPKIITGERTIVRRLRGAERDQVFTTVLTRIQREEISQVSACTAAGVSYGAFHAWLNQQRAIAKNKGPLLKPSGRLL